MTALLAPWLLLLPLLVFPALVFLVYRDALNGDYLIDDQQGMQIYDGVWQQPWWHWGNAFKKFRWEFGKHLNPQHGKQPNAPTFLPNARRHHRLSLYVFSGVVCLLYLFLSRVFTPTLAAGASLLFLVHPLGPQTVAWMSGIGYLVGAFFMLLGLNLALLLQDIGWLTSPLGVLGALCLYGVCQLTAVNAMFQMAPVVVILLHLKLYPFAIVAGLIALYSAANTFREAIVLRRKTFQDQQMGRSTQFYPKKLIVAVKTFAYYCRFVCFPKRMGLYHPWGYHYEVPAIELEDRLFWEGLLWIGGAIAGFVWGPPVLQLAILWYVAFVSIFLNWVTAMQFVTERYSWLPAVGACLLITAFSPPWAFWLIVGIAVMRLWVHLPTFKDDWSFYFSNLFNFPTSEVAMGNLGVAFTNRGMVGAGIDWWVYGAHVNPNYDVNWYNLGNAVGTAPMLLPLVMRTDGFRLIPQEFLQDAWSTPEITVLKIRRYLLVRAIRCKTCHFPVDWSKQLQAIDAELRWWYQSAIQSPDQRLAWQTDYVQTMLHREEAPELKAEWEQRWAWVSKQPKPVIATPPVLVATP